ncbi:hypothetical protein HY994_02260 [Candidatus Micrarchaeota archaeon]|nr:hypothetical protein [Candidatus Micrarchaeota archaeon]
MRTPRGQGAFEYVLLLGGVILITTLSLAGLLNAEPKVDSQKQCALAARQALGCFDVNGIFQEDSTFDFASQNAYCNCSNAQTGRGATSATPSVTPTPPPSPNPTATPTSNPSNTPTVTPTVTPSPQPSASPSVTPTATPTELPTLTPTPTATVIPEPDKMLFLCEYKMNGLIGAYENRFVSNTDCGMAGPTLVGPFGKVYSAAQPNTAPLYQCGIGLQQTDSCPAGVSNLLGYTPTTTTMGFEPVYYCWYLWTDGYQHSEYSFSSTCGGRATFPSPLLAAYLKPA